MSQQGEPQIKKAQEDEDMSMNAQDEGLFDQISDNQSDKNSQKKSKKLKKIKKSKKSKKEKKDKKDKKNKRRREVEEQQYDDDEEQDERNSLYDDEASSDDQEFYSEDREAEIGEEEENDRFQEMINKPSRRDQYFTRFQGKNDREINAQYSKRTTILRQNQAMYPGENDPKIYVVSCKPRHEDEMVLSILNKAKYLAETTKKLAIVTVSAMKKKFTGKIFVEAFSQKDVREALDGFNNVSLGRIVQLERQGYAELFTEKFQTKIQFEKEKFVRVTKGLYEGDLGQILRIRANSADVIVVPRLNVQQIGFKIREQTSKITDEKKRSQKEAQLLTLFLNYKSNDFKKKPGKKPLTREELEQQFSNNPAFKKIRLIDKPPGLLVLNFKFNEIAKNQGTYLPVEIMPFTTEGNFINKMNEEKGNFTTATSFKKGEEVEIIAGSMVGHHGVIFQVLGNIASILIKDKELKNQKVEEPLDNIMKRFKMSQRVKVISGADIGKTGTVLQILQKEIVIWTDNNNQVRVNKKNLEVAKQEIICEQNVHNLKKDDLIKTSKNQIGIVIETTKDNIKILDTNNSIQIINNMDFDSKLNTKNIVAKNRSGDEISTECLVIIRQGVFEGKKCKVIHVYRQNVFLFNANFNRTAGVSVQNAENLSLISKNQQPDRRNSAIKGNQANIGTTDSKDQITIGKTITLRTGPLKGYKGVVKSINKDKIQVRVLSKACTQWVPRENIAAKQEALQIGKTPNRRMGGNTHNYQPSPSRF